MSNIKNEKSYPVAIMHQSREEVMSKTNLVQKVLNERREDIMEEKKKDEEANRALRGRKYYR